MLTVEQVKLRLKIDHDDEDSDLELLIKSAFSAFEDITNRKLYEENETIPDNVLNGVHVNYSIIQGAISLIGYWRENPEASGIADKIPASTEWAWNRHRFVKVG